MKEGKQESGLLYSPTSPTSPTTAIKPTISSPTLSAPDSGKSVGALSEGIAPVPRTVEVPLVCGRTPIEAVPSGGDTVVVCETDTSEVVVRAEVLRVEVTVSTTRWTVLVMVQVVTRLLSVAAGYAS